MKTFFSSFVSVFVGGGLIFFLFIRHLEQKEIRSEQSLHASYLEYKAAINKLNSLAKELNFMSPDQKNEVRADLKEATVNLDVGDIRLSTYTRINPSSVLIETRCDIRVYRREVPEGTIYEYYFPGWYTVPPRMNSAVFVPRARSGLTDYEQPELEAWEEYIAP